MGWFQTCLVALALVARTGAQAAPVEAPPRPDGVVASCDDFVRITEVVFTGRTGATFRAGGTEEYLGGDTFGPRVLNIGGTDPAIYLQHHCG